MFAGKETGNFHDHGHAIRDKLHWEMWMFKWQYVISSASNRFNRLIIASFFFLFPLLNVLAPVATIIEKIMNSVNVLPVFWIFQSVVKHRNVWSKNSENLSLRINLGLKCRLSFVSKVPCITQMQIEGFFWSLICLRRFKFL